MTKPSADRHGTAGDLHMLREELARLAERVAALEASTAAPRVTPVPAPAPAPARAAPPAQEAPSDELLLVISAAIAAFLGKKPHIRQIRLIGSAAWAQQGRVTIQASHALALQHR